MHVCKGSTSFVEVPSAFFFFFVVYAVRLQSSCWSSMVTSICVVFALETTATSRTRGRGALSSTVSGTPRKRKCRLVSGGVAPAFFGSQLFRNFATFRVLGALNCTRSFVVGRPSLSSCAEESLSGGDKRLTVLTVDGTPSVMSYCSSSACTAADSPWKANRTESCRGSQRYASAPPFVSLPMMASTSSHGTVSSRQI